MKIVIINGQNHKGSSYHMGKNLANKLTDEKSIVEFFLPKDLNHFCLGCYSCIEDETRCPFWSEKEKIIRAMQQADLFIFTTPNYCMAPSGAMKSFLDFMFDYWMVHKPKDWMFYKKAVILSASAGATCKSVNEVIRKSLSGWGVSYVKTFGLPVNAKDWNGVPNKKKEKIEKKLSALAKTLKNNQKVRVGIGVKLTFAFMRMLHIKGWDSSPTEKEYWEEKGWIGKGRPWKNKKGDIKMENINIRLEEEKDYKITENVTREAFWNVYKPGCVEHFVLHNFRKDKDFIKELSFVLEKDDKIIGHVMYAKAEIKADNGQIIPILTFGPISILPEYKRQGYGKKLLDYSMEKATKMGYGAICITGNIDFYGKSGYLVAKTKNIFYHDMDRKDDCPFFLMKELKAGYLNGVVGEFCEPSGYFVKQEDVEEFDKQFPYKEKLKLEGQIF